MLLGIRNSRFPMSPGSRDHRCNNPVAGVKQLRVVRQVDNRQVSALAGCERSRRLLQPQRACAVDRAQLQQGGLFKIGVCGMQELQFAPQAQVGIRRATVGAERDAAAAFQHAAPGMRPVTKMRMCPRTENQ